MNPTSNQWKGKFNIRQAKNSKFFTLNLYFKKKKKKKIILASRYSDFSNNLWKWKFSVFSDKSYLNKPTNLSRKYPLPNQEKIPTVQNPILKYHSYILTEFFLFLWKTKVFGNNYNLNSPTNFNQEKITHFQIPILNAKLNTSQIKFSYRIILFRYGKV